MYLFNLKDEPVRPATQEETDASYAFENSDGIITVEGVQYYVDEADATLLAEWGGDSWKDEWRREIAMEAGMLGGCDAYTDAMGY